MNVPKVLNEERSSLWPWIEWDTYTVTMHAIHHQEVAGDQRLTVTLSGSGLGQLYSRSPWHRCHCLHPR